MTNTASMERAILGACMMCAGAYDTAVTRRLQAQDFSLDSHRRIFAMIVELREDGKEADAVAVEHELDIRHQLESVGGTEYVAGLLDEGIPYSADIRHHVSVVREVARLRRVQAACEAAGARALEGGERSAVVIGDLTDVLLQIQADTDDPTADCVTRFSDAVFNEWRSEIGREQPIGLTTGLKSLDRLTTGVRCGEYWILGGRTGDGKSSLALQMVAANCAGGRTVHLFSLEMTKADVLHRLWAQAGDVSFEEIRNPRKGVEETVRRAASIVHRWPLHVTEDSSLSATEICARARISIRQNKTELILVDFLQNVPNPARDERERLTRISGHLRQLAKDSGVPVIGVSQLSRPRDGNPNLRPTRFSLKESGALECDAHCILMCYRPLDETLKYTFEDELLIAKQRHGQVGNLAVRFNTAKLIFTERATRPSEQVPMSHQNYRDYTDTENR
jgi:replicative DNA helicase